MRRRAFLALAALYTVLPNPLKRLLAAVIPEFETRTVEIEDFRFHPEDGAVVYKNGAIDPYLLVVDGLVETPLKLSYNDLKALPQTGQISDFYCVEGWDVYDIPWSGIRFSEILRQVQLKPRAWFVTFHALGKTRSKVRGVDHYVESFALADLLEPKRDMLLALDLGGKPLPHDRGAPVRLVCPHDIAYKSIKFVTRIEFTDAKQEGWWTLANPIYPWEARVPERRLRRK